MLTSSSVKSRYNCTLLKLQVINKARNGFPGDRPYVWEHYSKDFVLLSAVWIVSKMALSCVRLDLALHILRPKIFVFFQANAMSLKNIVQYRSDWLVTMESITYCKHQTTILYHSLISQGLMAYQVLHEYKGRMALFLTLFK